MTSSTSVSLLHRIRNPADNEAWTRFDARYRSFIARFLQSQSVDVHLAEDVCQTTMKQVYQAITQRRFDHNGNKGAFRNWLRKVVVSQLNMHHRKVRPNEQPLSAGLEEELARPDSELARLWNEEHNQAILELVLDELGERTSDDSLQIFRRTFIDGVDPETVAQEFGRTRNAILVTKCKVLRRARDIAQKLLD